ncbi:hypothetical protein EVAR_59904_1 [Eumeta japonica]|uniref:Uncharacterized protein n=1 Tax=Eumeta variegata TaxID=151549 RepID=A0A4C2AEL0_EUMVA|nr:hypothetical protein EVAR_59904_1 [Eumeta japonica]
MSSRRSAIVQTERDGNVPALTKGRRNRWRRQKSVKQQNRVDAAIGESPQNSGRAGTSAPPRRSRRRPQASVHRLPTQVRQSCWWRWSRWTKLRRSKETDAGFTAIQAVGDFARASLRRDWPPVAVRRTEAE